MPDPLNEYKERIVKVPVRFVDGPENEYFLLQIPESKLQKSGVGSVLKIEVIRTNDHNIRNINIISNRNDDHSSNESSISNNLKPSEGNPIQPVLKTATSSPIIEETFTTDIYVENPEESSKTRKQTNITDLEFYEKSSLDRINHELPNNLINNSNADNLDAKIIESAMYKLRNLFINNKLPFFNRNSTNEKLLKKNSTEPRKVHRQRVLVYRGSTKYQPTNSSAQTRRLMKKIVRRRIRPSKSTEDLETSATAPEADTIDIDTEVSSDSKTMGRAKREKVTKK